MRSLKVLKPGLLTTVQDVGRWGFQHEGVPVAGPMDLVSHRLANLLVGNDPHAALLEITIVGPVLAFESEALFACTGAEFDLWLDGQLVSNSVVCQAQSGSVLRFGSRRVGARAYLAFAGGIDVPAVLGSRATHLVSKLGGIAGRAVRAGDRLSLGQPWADTQRGRNAAWTLTLPNGGASLRVMLGPQVDYFTPSAIERFCNGRYVVTTQSNRMAYRLDGPLLEHAGDADIVSDATPMGVIQVPASGQPILLMADRQTTGGYPKIGTVISADLPLAGQLAPGDWVAFRTCDPLQAIRALRDLDFRLESAVA